MGTYTGLGRPALRVERAAKLRRRVLQIVRLAARVRRFPLGAELISRLPPRGHAHPQCALRPSAPIVRRGNGEDVPADDIEVVSA